MRTVKLLHPEPAHRSIRNPSSLLEASVQASNIALEDAVALRPVGGFGLLIAPPPPPPPPPLPWGAWRLMGRFGKTAAIRGSFRSRARTASFGTCTEAA